MKNGNRRTSQNLAIFTTKITDFKNIKNVRR